MAIWSGIVIMSAVGSSEYWSGEWYGPGESYGSGEWYDARRVVRATAEWYGPGERVIMGVASGGRR